MPFIALLINEMQETYGFQICAPIDFYGKNTFVLLGIHEMVFTITLLCVKHFLWQGIQPRPNRNQMVDFLLL